MDIELHFLSTNASAGGRVRARSGVKRAVLAMSMRFLYGPTRR